MYRLLKHCTSLRSKILTFCTHERYQSNLSNVNADFYLLDYDGSKPWVKKYADLPENHMFLQKNVIPPYFFFDFVLCQSKWQYDLAIKIAQDKKLPLVCLEHTMPTSNFSPQQIEFLKQKRGNFNIFISEFNKNLWGGHKEDLVIPHCVDSEVFQYSDNHNDGKILTVQNDYINRDYCLGFSIWKKVTENLPVNPVGDTPGLSVATKNIEELVEKYQHASVFLNTAHESPIPTSLLEAMSCGCACVSVNTCAIPEYIKHGENGFLCNNLDDFQKYLTLLLNNPEERKRIGYNASITIKEKCSKEKHTNIWNSIIRGINEV